MEKLFSDVFYNRHCYGSLYKVHQQDEGRRQPIVDLQHSVDRLHMVNRNRVEFIGEDLAAKFRFSYELKKRKRTDSDSEDEYEWFLWEYAFGDVDMEDFLKGSVRSSDEIALDQLKFVKFRRIVIVKPTEWDEISNSIIQTSEPNLWIKCRSNDRFGQWFDFLNYCCCFRIAVKYRHEQSQRSY